MKRLLSTTIQKLQMCDSFYGVFDLENSK